MRPSKVETPASQGSWNIERRTGYAYNYRRILYPHVGGLGVRKIHRITTIIGGIAMEEAISKISNVISKTEGKTSEREYLEIRYKVLFFKDPPEGIPIEVLETACKLGVISGDSQKALDLAEQLHKEFPEVDIDTVLNTLIVFGMRL